MSQRRHAKKADMILRSLKYRINSPFFTKKWKLRVNSTIFVRLWYAFCSYVVFLIPLISETKFWSAIENFSNSPYYWNRRNPKWIRILSPKVSAYSNTSNSHFSKLSVNLSMVAHCRVLTLMIWRNRSSSSSI